MFTPDTKTATDTAPPTQAEREARFALGKVKAPAPDSHHNPALDEAANSLNQFVEWQGNVLSRLGLLALTGDVAADNPTLIAALAKIDATGAPKPVIVQETVAWPGADRFPAGAFTVDVYEYRKPGKPTVRLTEFLLAANPQIAINELRIAGQIE